MKYKKLYLFLFVIATTSIDAQDQTTTSETPNLAVATVSNEIVAKKEPAKVVLPQKPIKVEKPQVLIPIQKAIFHNARVNEIILIITNHKNKQFSIPVKMGQHYTYFYTYPAIKVVCHEKLTPPTPLSKTDLLTYTAFVFNDNQKTDKYHHISIHEKNKALKLARQSGDISLFNDVCEETIYNL
jgi:hypothetical protein